MDDAQHQALVAKLAILRRDYLARLPDELAALRAPGAGLHGSEQSAGIAAAQTA